MKRLKIINNHLNFAEEICIVGFIRSPIQPALAEFKDISLIDLAGQTIQGLLAKYSIDKHKIEEFYMGCAYPSSLGQSPAKQVAVNASLPDSISCMSINKLCASGMKAFILGCLSLKSKSAECVLVGGAESMSNYPFLLNIRNGINTKVKNSLY